jgi:hypothetical protein
MLRGFVPAVLLAVAAPVAAQPADLAASIAHSVAPREQFGNFVSITLNTSKVGQIIAGKVGAERAAKLFAEATADAVAVHGAEWETNLAASYREALTPAELVAAEAAVAARDPAALQPMMAKVAPVMKTKSTALLNRACLEAMTAVEAASEKP